MSSRSTRAGQIGLGGRAFENRSLFSENFLERRLPKWDEFKAIDVGPALGALADLWQREGATLEGANEPQTEDRLIQPVLDILGFEKTVQADARVAMTQRRIPDYALFTSLEARQESEGASGVAKFERAVALAEAKAFAIPLDKRGAGAGPREDPEAQVLD